MESGGENVKDKAEEKAVTMAKPGRKRYTFTAEEIVNFSDVLLGFLIDSFSRMFMKCTLFRVSARFAAVGLRLSQVSV